MVNRFPLLLRFAVPISTTSFSAVIRFESRALGFGSDENFWLSGVHPGQLTTGHSSSLREAAHEFRRVVQQSVEQLALETESFKVFRASLEAFFWAAETSVADAWDEARELVKAGAVNAGGIELETSPPAASLSIWEIPSQRRRRGVDSSVKEVDCPVLAA